MNKQITLSNVFNQYLHFLGIMLIAILTVIPRTFSQKVYPNPSPVDLLSAGDFELLAGSAVTIFISATVSGNVGSPTVTNVGYVDGNLGGVTVTNSGYVTGDLWGTTLTNSGTVDGTLTTGINTEVPQAQTDYASAYSNIAGLVADTNFTSGSDLGGLTLGRGIYASGSSFIINGTLTLIGTSSDIFIFKMMSTLTTSLGSNIAFTGGALASNVYWQVGSSATIDGDFKGNIFALTAITQNANASIDGKLFARDAAIEIHGLSALPVELATFSATTTGSTVKLNWNTATEVNNYGFEVEKKILKQVQIDNTVWEKIGFVNGNGNSNSPKDYSFVDDKVSTGKYSYRLKQIDNDGQFEYSKTIEVDFNTPNKFELSQNYPNPFNPSTTIRFDLPEASIVKLRIFNILGQEIRTLVNQFKESGTHTINFNASELNSGMYIYKIEAGNFVQTRKMTLLK
jgi:cytoskeletal protein CcmA (bactofilin family)